MKCSIVNIKAFGTSGMDRGRSRCAATAGPGLNRYSLFRNIALLVFLVSCCGQASAQAKIGDNKTIIQPGSVLELEATNKGLLNVRLNTAQMLSIPVTAASNGMMVYNTDSACVCLYTGSAWRNLCKGTTRQQRALYIAAGGDSTFLCPEIIYSDNYVQVFRNGVQVNFTATIGSRLIKLEREAFCKKDDEVKIIQLIVQ